MNIRNRTSLSAVVLAFAFSLQSCGGGGGGGGGAPAGTTLSGNVSAPAAVIGQLQHKNFLQKFATMFASLFVSESVAQATGLQPVPGANILVFQINNAGAPVGGVIASTTTDANGNYSLSLPAGTALAGNLVVQASPNTTPAPATSNSNLNCPAVGTTLNLNPAAQAATAAILQRIASAGVNLSNFTNAEIASFVSLVQTFAQDPALVSSNIQQTVTNITGALQPVITTALDGIATPGEATAPANFGGSYNFLGFHGQLGSGSFERNAESGTVTINSAAKTFSFSGTSNDVRLSEVCGTGGNACNRTFTRTLQLNKPESASGTYTLGGSGQIFLSSPDGIIPGVINPAGTIVVLSFVNAGGDLGIGVAIKQGTPATTGTFNFQQLHSQLPSGSTVPVTTWTGLATAIENGTVILSSSTFNGSSTQEEMQQSLTCTSTPQGSCTGISATINETSQAQTFSGTFTASASGSLTLTDSGGGVNTGAISSDGNILLVQGDDGSNGNVGLIIGTRQGSGMSLSSLNGVYSFVAFEDNFNSGGGVSTQITSGAVTFDGTGGFSVLGANTGVQRNENCGGTTCGSVSSRTETINASGTYTVSATGGVTMNGTDSNCVPSPGNSCTFSILGSASADGSVAVLRQVRAVASCGTNCSDAGRLLIVGVKQ